MPNPYSLSPVKPTAPGRLVVIGFSDEKSAFALRDHLNELEEEGILCLGDAVVATRNDRGKVRLHQSLPLISAGVAVGTLSGMLLGMLVLNPLFGSVAGAAVGAGAAALSDAGIDDAFMKDLAETLQPRSSALFVVVRNTKPERLLERLKPFAGQCRILQSSMSPENETRLRALLEDAIHAPASTSTTP